VSSDFRVHAVYGEEKAVTLAGMSDYFTQFVGQMLEFFKSGVPQIDKRETLEIAALIEAGQAALGTPDIWVPVPKV